ncbi:hypothetical protein LCGC14_0208800 [marine sediment metagenome]|uniref:Uncharacterized protein n=1 Tax=marine sediment metagenome TaxID=412755 RepID=A0A0F9UL88_9ZZZZ
MATQVQPDKAIIAALGPFKIEVVRFTAVSNDDTYTSRLAQPLAAFCFPTVDAGSTTQNQSATIGTGSNQKVVTFRDPAKTTQTLIVFGF